MSLVAGSCVGKNGNGDSTTKENSIGKSSKSNEIKEGLAVVGIPGNGVTDAVFYNPVQVFNRDFSILVLNWFVSQRRKEERHHFDAHSQRLLEQWAKEGLKEGDNRVRNDGSEAECKLPVYEDPKITILEALAASGLRSIRYSLEVPHIHRIVANDFDSVATQAIVSNAALNGVQILGSSSGVSKSDNTEFRGCPIEVSCNDATALLYNHRTPESAIRDRILSTISQSKRVAGMSSDLFLSSNKRFSVIDIDPYGSPSVFIDGAVQAVEDGGLLAITCTDMAVLCGNHPETAYTKYGGIPTRSRACHEIALRIVIGSIATAAARYKRYIVPVVSISVDFYVRVWMRVWTSPHLAKSLPCNMGMIYSCYHCQAHHFQPLAKLQLKKDSENKMPTKKSLKNCDSTSNELQQQGDHDNEDDEFINVIDTAIEPDDKDIEEGSAKYRPLPPVKSFPSSIMDAPWKFSGNQQQKFSASTGPPSVLGMKPASGNANSALLSTHGSCEVCGGHSHVAGPMWMSELHNSEVVSEIMELCKDTTVTNSLASVSKINGYMASISNELIDAPLYYVVDALCGAVAANALPVIDFRNALHHLGYRTSVTHCRAGGVKTDAPPAIIWEVIKHWAAKEKPNAVYKPRSLAWEIMSRPRLQFPISAAPSSSGPSLSDVVVKFSYNKDVNTMKNVTRFIQNPENWGPRAKANSGGKYKRAAATETNVGGGHGSAEEGDVQKKPKL